jgi:energy-coupling factor transport system ATP-binding protein
LANAISVEALSFRYAGRKRVALRDVTFSVPEGETLLVLGPSGCGKSTLALCLNGMIPHVVAGELSGSVRIHGALVAHQALADTVSQVGIVFQDPEAQMCMLRVDEEIAFGLENLAVPPAEMPGRIRRALSLTGLECAGSTRIDWLSGGNKQRLALASVLATEPSVLIFDEPTSNLDPAGARAVFAVIARLKAQGRHTIVVVEHRLDQLMHLVDRVLVLGPDGRLVDDGEPHQVLERQARALDELGIWKPQVCEVADALARRGFMLGGYPITVDEAARTLGGLAVSLRNGNTAVPRVEPPGTWGTSTPTVGPHRNGGRASPQPEPSGNLTSSPIVGAHWNGGTASPRAEPSANWTSSTMVGPHADNAASAVSIRGLTARYGRGADVLHDVRLEVQHGDILALVGSNGAGKSTLAHHLIATLRADRGTVFVDGRDIRDVRNSELAETVGYVFQNPEHQFVARSVFDELAFGLRLRGEPEAEVRARVEAMLDDFGLSGLAAANPFKLSHGEKRRLSVATMLILKQRLLVLDEPTFGQDRRHAAALLQKFRALNTAGTTLIIITHDMRLVAEHATRAAVLHEGRLLASSGVDALFEDAALLEEAHLEPPPIRALSERLFGASTGGRLPAAVDELVDCLTVQPVGVA